MADLRDGESVLVQGSAAKPYEIKNLGGVYSCTCPAWRNQSVGIERRTCKHIRALRGDAAEQARLSAVLPARPAVASLGEEGDAANGPPLLLAHTWENDTDLTGWWMSEKLDGVRAYWDGKQLLSRQGNLYHAPAWFVAGLPSIPLDGELWIGRKVFQRTVSVVRRQDQSEHWKDVRYVLFDAPQEPGGFEKRLQLVQDVIRQQRPPYAMSHPHEVCKSIDHLRQELARVEGLGGEGLMLRQPSSRYEVGRSATLLKVKTFHDAEARVIGHQEGAGKHKGRLGALLVELADGTRFAVGTGFSDRERSSPPAVGSFITFRYQELSDKGVPRFPSYVGVRTDVSPAASSAPPRGQSASPAFKVQAGKGLPTLGQAPNPAARPASAPTPIAESQPRRFEFVAEESSKFWEITVTGCDVVVRYGRIGTNGQQRTKTLTDETAAIVHADKLINEKVREGYVEV